MKVLVVDNYDSFTYNLVQYLGELGAEVEVIRNDVDDLLEREPGRVIVSPGPCTPNKASGGLACHPRGTRRTIDPEQAHNPGPTGEGLCNEPRSVDKLLGTHASGLGIGAEHRLRVEERHQGLEVAFTRGAQEGVDDRPFALDVAVRFRNTALNASPGPARQLPRGDRRAIDDRRDLSEGHIKHVMQDEREALWR